MNAKGIFISIFLFILVLIWNPTYAQQASAELISSHGPAKLVSGEEIREGIQNLFFVNKRMYVVNIWSGLQILDVSSANTPKELGNYKTIDRAFNVFVDDRYAYVSQKSGGVLILDVSNPADIKKVSEIKTKGNAYWVLANYPTVYVAEETEGVGIYDISDLANPRDRGKYDTKGWAWNLFLAENKLYVGDKTGGLLILDVSNPDNPQLAGKYANLKFTKSIQVENNIMYVAEGPDGLAILDISNPFKPVLLSKFTLEGWVNHVFKSGNSVFLSNDRAKNMVIVDVSDPRNPVLEGEYRSDNKIYAAIKSDVYVYVAANKKSLVLRYNRPPKLEPIAAQFVDENQVLSFQAVGSDPDQDEIFYSIQNMPETATFDSISGLFNWVPNFDESGIYKDLEIIVTERTATALSASRKFDINVQHVNRMPELPVVENYEVDENQVLTFKIPEGSDPDTEDQRSLVYSIAGLPEGASFDPVSRMYKWKPTFEQSGSYPLTFTISDPPGLKAERLSTVTVKHVDRKPVLAEVGEKFVDENAVLSFTLEGKDLDKEDQNLLSYKEFNLPEGAEFNAATAMFSWTPTYEQSGVYRQLLFVFTAGALSDSVYADVAVAHVNRPPVLDAVVNQLVDENKLLTFSISGSDPDKEDAGKLVLSAENLPEGSTFNPDSAIFSWTPNFEQSGSFEQVSFRISDPDGLSDAKSITVDVAHVNRVPALAVIEEKTVDENTMLEFDLTGTDPDREDEGKLVYTIDKLPEGAVLDGNHFSWTPTYDQSGQYPVKFTVSDARLEDSKETIFTVNHVNRPPVLNTIAAQQVKENALLEFSVSGSDPDTEDEGKLSITAKNLPQGATFDSSKALFSWTPTFEQSGQNTIGYTITDPSGLNDAKEVIITTEHVNRTPVFTEQASQVVDENALLTFNLVPATDPDKEDEGKITYTVADLPPNATFDDQNLVFSWTPGFDQSGEYTAMFTVTDGAFKVDQPFKVTVNHVNRPPVVEQPVEQNIDENSSWKYTMIYSDPDQEDQGKLVISADNLPGESIFDASTGVISWTPSFEQSGSYEGINLHVSDPAGLSDQKTFALQVQHVNRAPKLVEIEPQTVNENEELEITLLANDPDKEDDGKLSFKTTNIPQGATLDEMSGTFSWTPTFLQAGSYTVNFQVVDSGNLTSDQTATITVPDINHAPQIETVENVIVKENESLTFTVSATDEDTDNTITYSIDGLPEGASFDNSTGAFVWKPGYDQAKEYTITFKANDGKEEVQTTATITVENVNRAPEIKGPTSEEAEAEETLNFSYSAKDSDKDDLTFEISGLPSGATFDSKSAKFSWVTKEGQAGTYDITVSVTDGQDKADISTTITIKPKPEPVIPDTTVNQ